MGIRVIAAEEITRQVRRLCIEANRELPQDLEQCIRCAAQKEEHPIGKSIMEDLCANMDAARELSLPVCQDTGMAVVFAEIGQDVHIDGNFEDAVNEGVRQGYVEGLLRCSVVADPIRRGNTNDNTPAVLHTRLVPGDKVHLMVAPKGFGSENMSRVVMLTPSATREQIIGAVAETARLAGACSVSKEKGWGSSSPGWSSSRETSTLRAWMRGGVPVLNRRRDTPRPSRLPVRALAAARPSGPEERDTSPTMVRPPRWVPVAATAAFTRYTAPVAVRTADTRPFSVRMSVTSACFTHRLSCFSRACFITCW